MAMPRTPAAGSSVAFFEAEWIHVALFGIIVPTIKLKVFGIIVPTIKLKVCTIWDNSS